MIMCIVKMGITGLFFLGFVVLEKSASLLFLVWTSKTGVLFLVMGKTFYYIPKKHVFETSALEEAGT